MKIATRVLGLALPVLPFLALPALAGAPAAFDVRSAEVQVRRAAATAEVRIVYDVAIQDAACGWFQTEIEGLPKGESLSKAFLACDGTEHEMTIEERDGVRYARAFREDRQAGVRMLAAKEVRLVLVLPAVEPKGPEISVGIPMPHTDFSHRNGGKTPTQFPSVGVRFVSETAEGTVQMHATFRAVATGSKVVVRTDARSAGASVVQ